MLERRTVLLDLYTAADSHDGKSLAAYRKGKFKLIQGSYKDAHWYSEPSEDRVKTSDEGLLARVYGMLVWFLDMVKSYFLRECRPCHRLDIW